METWRLCRQKHSSTPLDGEGARLHGGRWNPPGFPCVYSSGSLSLAALEQLIHVDHEDAPDDLVSIRITIPETVSIEVLTVGDLPAAWRVSPSPTSLQSRGRKWIESGSSPVLRVPSVVVPSENNFLINPKHLQARLISAQVLGTFDFDPRLFS